MDGNMKRWKRPAIGFQLTPELSDMPANKINNAVEMFRALFETMSSAHDIRYIDQDHARNIVFIPVLDVKATDFELTDKQKENLIVLGREETSQFLGNWSY
jgi:NTE family protein